MSESCLSPSLGWLSPTKMSSFKALDAPQEVLYENMTKAFDDRQRVKERSNDRDSMSEFEFAMSTIKNDNMHGEHMLAADELFFKGKLLPLYNPDYRDGSEQQVSRCNMRDQANQQILSNHPTSSCTLYSADAENSQANTRDLIIATSPKVPKCSMMLKEFFGLKKMAKSICACTASGEVTTPSFSKSSRSGSKKAKATKNNQKANAPSPLCKALSCASRNANCITAKARHSVSEPLLTCCAGQIGYPLSSIKDNHQANRQHYEHLEKGNAALSPPCVDVFDIACTQRSNTVSDSLCTDKDSPEQRLLGTNYSEDLSNEENTSRRSSEEQSRGSRRWSLHMGLGEMSLDKTSCGALNYDEKACWGCRSNMSPPRLGETSPGRSSCSASYEENTYRRSTGEQSKASMRTHPTKLISHRSSSYEGSSCRALAGEQNRGSRRLPMQVGSGESSPERISCPTSSYEENTCRGVITEESRGSTRPPMRIHIAETSPERISCSALSALASQPRYATSETLKSTEISRTKILERSSSYSPKSLQRKYEQLKAIRQREGWRILERSSSYNSGMHSMRVAPVLNVPIIVCMSRSKSSNHGIHTRRKA